MLSPPSSSSLILPATQGNFRLDVRHRDNLSETLGEASLIIENHVVKRQIRGCAERCPSSGLCCSDGRAGAAVGSVKEFHDAAVPQAIKKLS